MTDGKINHISLGKILGRESLNKCDMLNMYVNLSLKAFQSHITKLNDLSILTVPSNTKNR
jgi:hypothetical protein